MDPTGTGGESHGNNTPGEAKCDGTTTAGDSPPTTESGFTSDNWDGETVADSLDGETVAESLDDGDLSAEEAESQRLNAFTTNCNVLRSIMSFCKSQLGGEMSEQADSGIQTLERVLTFSQQGMRSHPNLSELVQVAAYFDVFGSGIGASTSPNGITSTFADDCQTLEDTLPVLLSGTGSWLIARIGLDAYEALRDVPALHTNEAADYSRAAAQRSQQWETALFDWDEPNVQDS